MTLTLTNQEKKWGWLYLLLQLLVVPFAAAIVCTAMGQSSVAFINGISFFANAMLAVVFFRRLLAQSLRNVRGQWGKTIRTVLRGFGMYWLASTAVSSLILTLKPDFGNVNDQSIGGMIAEFPWLMNLAVIFAAPLAEECLFRGWIFTGLARKNLKLAYCVTCGVFSAAHVVGYIGLYAPSTLFLCFLQYLAPSYVLCRTCEKSDSLAAPLLLHMTINALSCLITGML